MSGALTVRMAPPSSDATLLRIWLNTIEMSSALAASRQPPNAARLLSQVTALAINVEKLRTAMAPPLAAAPAAELTELLRNVHDVAVSVDDFSTSSAPPLLPSEILQSLNVDDDNVAATLLSTSPRAACAENCSDVSTTLCVTDEPVMVTAAPAVAAGPPPRSRKPLSSKCVGDVTSKQTPVLHTSSQQLVAETAGSVAQAMLNPRSGTVATGVKIVCVAQLNVVARMLPPQPFIVPRLAPMR